MISSLHIPVTEQGQAGEARRIVKAWALEFDCDPALSNRVALVVTELAKNLALHTTRGGGILVRRLQADKNCGVGILSLDRGPGVENFGKCLRDGYSTAGTSGIGLGGVRRMSQTFEAHSQRGVGTAVYAETWAHQDPDDARPLPWRAGAVSVPMQGETVCGDSWAEQHGAHWSRFCVIDGLGHGPQAAEAAYAARAVFCESAALTLPVLLRAMHERLRSTRGAAVGVAHLDFTASEVRFAGLGNIAAAIVVEDRIRHFPSNNGTLGVALPSAPREFVYSVPEDFLLVMHSDGLKTQWRLSHYAGVAERHPELIAGVLFRDFSRGGDDSTVLAIRRRN